MLACAFVTLSGPGVKAASLEARLKRYQRCVAVRSVVSPRVFASEDERVMGAAVDCARHKADTLKTVTSAPTPLPRVLRSRRVMGILSGLLHGGGQTP